MVFLDAAINLKCQWGCREMLSTLAGPHATSQAAILHTPPCCIRAANFCFSSPRPPLPNSVHTYAHNFLLEKTFFLEGECSSHLISGTLEEACEGPCRARGDVEPSAVWVAAGHWCHLGINFWFFYFMMQMGPPMQLIKWDQQIRSGQGGRVASMPTRFWSYLLREAQVINMVVMHSGRCLGHGESLFKTDTPLFACCGGRYLSPAQKEQCKNGACQEGGRSYAGQHCCHHHASFRRETNEAVTGQLWTVTFWGGP